MIKKLRRKFIIYNMCLVGLIALVVCALGIGRQIWRVNEDLDNAMSRALENTRETLPDSFDSFFVPRIGGGFGDNKRKDDDKYLRYSPLIYTVAVDSFGDVLYVGNNEVTIDDEVLYPVINAVLAVDSDSGRISEVGLFYLRQSSVFGVTKIALADSASYYTEIRATVVAVAILFITAMAAFFGVSLVMASLFVKPVKTAWEQQQTFVADASHELKTPLTVILANTDILKKHPEMTVGEQSQWVDSTYEEAQSMKSLVDELLFLAKNDAHKNVLNVERTDLSELAISGALQFEPVAFESEIRVDYDVDDGVFVDGDRAQLKRLIHILIDNAVKYAGGGGLVAVSLKKAEKGCVLTVRNTGPVINGTDLPHIFERFYRADKARSGSGYGLGLSIAKTIVDAHKGSISCTSDERNGTVFTVKLP